MLGSNQSRISDNYHLTHSNKILFIWVKYISRKPSQSNEAQYSSYVADAKLQDTDQSSSL